MSDVLKNAVLSALYVFGSAFFAVVIVFEVRRVAYFSNRYYGKSDKAFGMAFFYFIRSLLRKDKIRRFGFRSESQSSQSNEPVGRRYFSEFLRLEIGAYNLSRFENLKPLVHIGQSRRFLQRLKPRPFVDLIQLSLEARGHLVYRASDLELDFPVGESTWRLRYFQPAAVADTKSKDQAQVLSLPEPVEKFLLRYRVTRNWYFKFSAAQDPQKASDVKARRSECIAAAFLRFDAELIEASRRQRVAGIFIQSHDVDAAGASLFSRAKYCAPMEPQVLVYFLVGRSIRFFPGKQIQLYQETPNMKFLKDDPIVNDKQLGAETHAS